MRLPCSFASLLFFEKNFNVISGRSSQVREVNRLFVLVNLELKELVSKYVEKYLHPEKLHISHEGKSYRIRGYPENLDMGGFQPKHDTHPKIHRDMGEGGGRKSEFVTGTDFLDIP